MSVSEQELIAHIQQQTMPFVNDPPFATRLYDAIGRMVLMWGRLEQTLDDLLITAIVFANKIDDYDIYASLSRKLDILKHVYNNCPELKHLHPKAVSIAADVKKNSENRNPVIHASWTGFRDGNPPRILMTNLKHGEGTVTLTDIEPSLTDLINMSSNFHLCRAKLISLLRTTSEIIKKA